MEKILILGTGSLGSEIAYWFSNDCKVTCIDHGKNFDIIKKQLQNVKLVKGDSNDLELIKKESEFSDIIFYCIDTGGVLDCIKYPEKYYDINITNFEELLASLKSNKAHFFLFSSIFVYPNIPNVTEKAKLNPETIYGKFRLQQEQILIDSGLDFTILRLSNIFGYGHFFNVGNLGAIEKFIQYVFNGKKITLHGDGSQKVDYIYKDDLMKLLKILIKKLPKNAIYNVSTGRTKKISEIAEIIKYVAFTKFGKKVDVVKLYESLKLPDIPQASPNKVIKETLWRPSSNIKNRIRFMMKLFNSNEINL